VPQISNHQTTKNKMHTPTKKEQKTQNKNSERAINMRSRSGETDENAHTERERERERERESAVEKEPLPDLKIRPLVTVSFCNVISNPLEAVIHYDAVANGWMDG